MYGRLISSWTIVGNRFRLTVAVPPNVSATVLLPCTSLEDVTESGIPLGNVPGIALVPEQQGRVQIGVSAGRYEFECPKS